jgi:isoamylase
VIRQANKAWHGVKLQHPDWGDSSHSVAFTVELRHEMLFMHVIQNAFWGPLVFDLPQAMDGREIAWRRWIDTALDSPNDIVDWQNAPPHKGYTYCAEARSVAVLIADPERSLK